MSMKNWSGFLWLSAVLAFLFCIPGCDNGPDVTDASSYFDSHPLDFTHYDLATDTLSITWADASLKTKGLAANGDVAVFSGGGGTPPYTWDVLDASRGTILDSRGSYSAYRRIAAGNNVVALKDSAGNKAYITIPQP